YRSGPLDCVRDDVENLRMIVNGVGFVAGAEVEDAPLAAIETASAAEHLAAFKPADEDEFIRRRYVKALTVHFSLFDFEVLAQSGRNGVIGLYNPDALFLSDLAPLEIAGRPHECLEDLREVSRVKDDQPHTTQDPLLDSGYH